MTAIEKLNNKSYPVTIVHTINDIIDLTNDLANKDLAFSADCPQLVPSEGVASWEITHNLDTEDVMVSIYNDSDEQIFADVEIDDADTVIAHFATTSNIAAGTYKVVIFANGGFAGAGAGAGGSTLNYCVNCPALTPTDGVVTWSISHNLNSYDIITALYADGVEIAKTATIKTANTVEIAFRSSENVTAGDYRAVILAV